MSNEVSELLTWDKVLTSGPGIYQAVENRNDSVLRYVVISDNKFEQSTADIPGFINGICYIGFTNSGTVSPSLLYSTVGAVEPVITIHQDEVMWRKCEHLDLRICLRSD